MRILLVEDDLILGDAICDQIIADGGRVDWAKDLATADTFQQKVGYDVILLDLMLPDGLGKDHLKVLRAEGDTTPVIILTALDQLSDRIEGLNAGADDYLVKPFHLDELSARISAVARRYSGNPNPYMEFGELLVNIAERHIRLKGENIKLTSREWAIAEAFFLNPDGLHTKTELEGKLTSIDKEIQPNTVEVYISRLRKKLGSDRILTERGLGYRFNI